MIFFLELIKSTHYMHPDLIALDAAHYPNKPKHDCGNENEMKA